MKMNQFSSSRLLNSFKALPWRSQGRVKKIKGNLVEATLEGGQLGTICEIEISHDAKKVLAEVVGFKDDECVLLLPYNNLEGCAPGSSVSVVKNFTEIKVGEHLLGKVISPFMESLNDDAILAQADLESVPLDKKAPNPMTRQRIKTPLSLGVRAIDSLLTVGEGQRVGIMAGSGVGKSVLLGMMARNSSADINVIGLIGERGREVREFIEKDLGPEGLKRSVIVAVTSDQSPLMKIRGAKVATAISEYFSSKGKSVLLMVDSITRVAMAQREIGSSVGEPPTTKGYTPSVFSLLPSLLERSGPQKVGSGSISGLYTVLVDGDDFNDPIADAVRSILDGHINLSRDLAARHHFPAIEVSTSASRVMHDIAHKDHLKLAEQLKNLIGTYQQNYDLIQIGAYQEGRNQVLDRAIKLMPKIQEFLKQGINEKSDLNQAVGQMLMLLQSQDIGQQE